MRTLYSLLGNQQWLDGGAMFGNVPKAMWSQWVDVDERNRINLCCRALLVQEGQRWILFETGIGAFFEPKLRERYGVVESEHVLLKSLKAVGLSHTDIDVVVLSHLHFDHTGGLMSAWEEGHSPTLLFPNATFLASEEAFHRAKQPHLRDKASFIPMINQALENSGRLNLIQGTSSPLLGKGFRFRFSAGHTPGLMISEIEMPGGPVVFAADLIPGAPWVHLPVTMGYDRFPELLINEKENLLTDLLAKQGRLFFTHDTKVALGRVAKDEKGRFKVIETKQDVIQLTN